MHPLWGKNMKNYFITLFFAALIGTLIGILSPQGEKNGIEKHMKLLLSLFLICVLIAPLHSMIDGLRALAEGEIELPFVDGIGEDDYQTKLDSALDSASTAYFAEMLAETLQEKFEIPENEIRCSVTWEKRDGELKPIRITAILSGGSIWKDPQPIEDFVVSLLGCPCETAVE